MKKTTLAAIIFVALFLAIMIYSMLGVERYKVEVCVNFQGRTACRTASAGQREQALRTATENACALVASGMTDSIACGNAPPARVTWIRGN